MSGGPGRETGLETSNSLRGVKCGAGCVDHGVSGSCRKILSRDCPAAAADSKHSPWRWHHGAQMERVGRPEPLSCVPGGRRSHLGPGTQLWGLSETRLVCRLHGFRPGCGDPGPVRVAFLEHRGPPKASNPSSSSQRTGERVLPSVLCALRLGFFDTPPQLLQLKAPPDRVPPPSWRQPEHKAGCFRSLIESSEPQVLFWPLLSGTFISRVLEHEGSCQGVLHGHTHNTYA